MSGDYEVGYRKPPRHSRFAKGQSGNPRGRTRGSRNLKTVLTEELKARITVRERGAERSLTKLEALMKSLVNQGLKGNVRAALEVLILASRFEDGPSAPAEAPLTAEERAVLEAALVRLGPEPAAKPDEGQPHTKPRRKPEPEGSA